MINFFNKKVMIITNKVYEIKVYIHGMIDL